MNTQKPHKHIQNLLWDKNVKQKHILMVHKHLIPSVQSASKNLWALADEQIIQYVKCKK